MPKEIIKGVGGMYDVHVGWSEETVQIGVVTADRGPVVDALTECPEVDGIWSTLSSDTLDNLILLLNRVRIKAYPNS
jgi:hypothetical protein